MTFKIDKDELRDVFVDRGSGYQDHVTGELVMSFQISACGLSVYFEDERDAVRQAKLILQRMGETYNGEDVG